MNNLARSVTLAASLLLGAAVQAGPCAYKWDVSNEVRLYATAPTAVTAATATAPAPAITVNKLYALTLQPQEAVHFDVAPSKRMLPDGAFGGVLKFTVGSAGAYRIAIDAGFWLDVVQAGKSLPAADFSGDRGCAGPHKIVVYELPAGVELTLQLAAATSASAQLTVTPVAAPTP